MICQTIVMHDAAQPLGFRGAYLDDNMVDGAVQLQPLRVHLAVHIDGQLALTALHRRVQQRSVRLDVTPNTYASAATHARMR